MNCKPIPSSFLLPLVLGVAAFAQTSAVPIGAPGADPTLEHAIQGAATKAGPQSGVPVSYASVTQLNGLLAQLEAASKTAQADLTKLRIDRWKADGSYKKQSLSHVDSIQRNLQGALPEIVAQLRATPEDLPTTFKLYRNLDALYDVMESVAESAGAFGSKDDFQAISNDLSTFEGTRKQFAERIENLSSSKEAEIVRLRSELKTAQAAIPVTLPKKIVVDDNEPAKKPAKKKAAAKPAGTATPTAKPATGQASTQTQAAPKPQ